MNIAIKEGARWCAVEHDEKPSPAKMRRAILRNENIQTDFSTLSVPAAPRDQTTFKICGNDKTLLVAIALFDAPSRRGSYERLAPMTDQAEIYFDCRHDRLGYFRFGFTPEVQSRPAGGPGSWRDKSPDIEIAKIDTTTFLPYPEAHSSAYPLLRAPRAEMTTEYFESATYANWRCRWVYAWFDTAEVFRFGDEVGFNICRYRNDTLEFTGWNFPSGNGGPDATSFGTLHRKPPRRPLRAVTARRQGNTLHLAANAGKVGELQWELTTPLSEQLTVKAQAHDDEWWAALPLKKWEAGRYQLKARTGKKTMAPADYFFDFAPPKSGRHFKISMTYDPPMSLMANHYTPDRLRDEMEVMKNWGVERVHWIDYSNAPSLWSVPLWKTNFIKTHKACGDFLQCAATQAHVNGLELIADFKIFDLGLNTFYIDHPCTVREFDGRRTLAIPEIVAHPEWTMQTNPAWRRAASFPITRLRFYSQEALPKIDPSRISLAVSKDNRTYKKYSGPLTVKQGVLRRLHARWTPAGKERHDGTARNWYIELSDLKINTPFAALQIDGEEISALHHGFMLIEAEDDKGDEVPMMLATTGHRDFTTEGYFFSKEWPGWNNYTEPMVWQRHWQLNDLGMGFGEADSLPTLLEPSYEGARNIWLNRIQKMLEAGVDGVCIRILNQHNGISSWLQYALAPVIVETFEKRFHRAPTTSPEDYEHIRRIRGEYFTQFLRDAKKLTSACGKKLMVQLESGIETPPHLDTRMQLFLDYQTWLKEGIVDEALMKDWTAQSPWVHEHILPLARRKKIPIHIITRCLSNGFDTWNMETIPQMLTDAYKAGFSGYNFYETDNLVELNPEGVPTAKGYSTPVFAKAMRELRTLQGNT